MGFGVFVMFNAFKMEIQPDENGLQSLRSELKDSYFAVWLSKFGFWFRT